MAIPYSRTIIGGITWYSVLIVLGILTAVFLAEREEKRLGLPRDTALDLALVVVPCGIVGARLYYVAMTWSEFAGDPLSILYVWEGGVAIYGAVIGGGLGVFLYARRRKLPWLRLMDALVPGVLLAQAIGRWGNYFNMEAYGPEIKNTLFQFFPAGVLIPAGNGYAWHMATFFYESLWNLCGAAALWGLRKRQRADGDLLCWYFMIYGSGRFIIEQLREDSLYLGGFRVSQMLSLLLCALSAAALLRRATQKDPPSFFLSAAGMALLLARWGCLGSLWLYLGAAAGGAALLWAAGARQARKRDPQPNKETKGPRFPAACVVFVLALLADGAGLWFFTLDTPFRSFAYRLHTLLCSLTLPVCLGAILSVLGGNEQKEASPCPSES